MVSIGLIFPFSYISTWYFYHIHSYFGNWCLTYKDVKSMPSFKAFKDRITILLGGSVVGFKLKSFAVCHSNNPRTFKHISKHTLP
jgi:hypothetical protein